MNLVKEIFFDAVSSVDVHILAAIHEITQMNDLLDATSV
jgi:hypothetical protein